MAFLVPLANSDTEASQLEMKAPAEKGGDFVFAPLPSCSAKERNSYLAIVDTPSLSAVTKIWAPAPKGRFSLQFPLPMATSSLSVKKQGLCVCLE